MTAIVSLFAWAFSDLSCFAIFIIDIVIAKFFFEMAMDGFASFRNTAYYRLLRRKLNRGKRLRVWHRKEYRTKQAA